MENSEPKTDNTQINEEANQEFEPYERLLTKQALETKLILITKDRLEDFPPVDETFKLKYKEHSIQTKIFSDPCWCLGPEHPHEHYFLDIADLVEDLDLTNVENLVEKDLFLIINKIEKDEYELFLKVFD